MAKAANKVILGDLKGSSVSTRFYDDDIYLSEKPFQYRPIKPELVKSVKVFFEQDVQVTKFLNVLILLTILGAIYFAIIGSIKMDLANLSDSVTQMRVISILFLFLFGLVIKSQSGIIYRVTVEFENGLFSVMEIDENIYRKLSKIAYTKGR